MCQYVMCLMVVSCDCHVTISYTVENAYLEEKEDACNAIGEIARNLGLV